MAGEGHAHRQKLSPEGPPSVCARAANIRARLSFAKSRTSAAYETMTILANVSPAIMG
jgi:hypothetical protein